jgi:hypothetical protein
MTRFGFSFKKEPVWMVAFSGAVAVLGLLILLFVVLFRQVQRWL